MPLDVRSVLDVQEGDIVELEVVSVRRRRAGTPSASHSASLPPITKPTSGAI